jgi:hypothetical protein
MSEEPRHGGRKHAGGFRAIGALAERVSRARRRRRVYLIFFFLGGGEGGVVECVEV